MTTPRHDPDDASAVNDAGGIPDSAEGGAHVPVVDLRNLGLVAAVELEPRPGRAGTRAFDAFLDCFAAGLLIRVTADVIALSPPLVAEREHVDQIFDTLAQVLRRLA